MATLDLTPTALHIRFTVGEKLLGLLHDLEVPLVAIAEVHHVDDALRAARGIRAPGLAIPGRRKIGTWRRGGRTAVAVRRGLPAIHLRLTDHHYNGVLVSHPHAAHWAARITDARRQL